MLVYAPLALLSLFALSSLVAMAEAGEFPLPFVFSAAFLLSCAASLLGMTVQANVPPDVNLGPYLWVVLSSYFCIVVVHLGFVAWQQACSTDDPDALQDAGMRNEGETDTLHALQHERIVTLANGYALTKREREILQYLSLGYGSVYISQNAVHLRQHRAHPHPQYLPQTGRQLARRAAVAGQRHEMTARASHPYAALYS